MIKLITARQAFEDKEWLGALVGGTTFTPMRTIAIAALGEPVTAIEQPSYTQLTGGRLEAPSEPVSELWILCGRRSGKTVMIAALACYLAVCVDHKGAFALGERGTIPIMAQTTTQAQSLMNICKGVFTYNPRFAGLVDTITADTISLTKPHRYIDQARVLPLDLRHHRSSRDCGRDLAPGNRMSLARATLISKSLRPSGLRWPPRAGH